LLDSGQLAQPPVVAEKIIGGQRKIELHRIGARANLTPHSGDTEPCKG
jgi:hypothetical protein